MNYKKIGLGLSISMAVCFMACGESSSPNGPENPSDPESSSSVKSSPASSSDVTSSSSVAETPSSSSVEEAKPCSFVATDDAWTVSYKGSDSKNNAKITTVYEISGKDLVIRDSVRYTGSMTSMMCSIDPEATYKSDDGVFAGGRTCDSDGNTVVEVTTTTQKDFFATISREEFFNSVQKACKAAVDGGSFEKVTFNVLTKCSFTMDDDEWSYFYKDEDIKGDSIPMKKLLFPDPEDGRYVTMKYSIYPMSHIECVAKNFADFNGIHYCSADAYLNIASSSTTFDKQTLYDIELKACRDHLSPDVGVPDDNGAQD